MDEAIAFIQNFIEQEYLAFKASYEERDEDIYEDQRELVDLMYGGGLRTNVNRDLNTSEEWFAEAPRHLAALKRRTLFQVKQYAHPNYGSVYACYVSSPIGWLRQKDGVETAEWSDSYDWVLYVAKIVNRRTGQPNFKIITQQNTGSGRSLGNPLEPLGALQAVKQFQPPADPQDLAEYEATSKAADELASGGSIPAVEPAKEVAKTETEAVAAPKCQDLSSMPLAKARFIERFGDIAEVVLWQRNFLGVVEEDPAYVMCLKLLGGRFYTSGFFPDGKDPAANSLPWQDLGDAMVFAQNLVSILRDGGCTALESEGDRTYYPLVCYDDKLAYVPSCFTTLEHTVQGKIKSAMLTKYNCPFWPNQRNDYYKEYLEPKAYKAYRAAGKLMKETLKGRATLAIVQSPEFPVVIGGTFRPGVFAGVITTKVYT